MASRGISLEQKQAWMRERHAPAQAVTGPVDFGERHYSPAEIAEAWGLSIDAVRKLFQNEPGVLVLGNDSAAKRRYSTLRIPASVAARVHRRLSNV